MSRYRPPPSQISSNRFFPQSVHCYPSQPSRGHCNGRMSAEVPSRVRTSFNNRINGRIAEVSAIYTPVYAIIGGQQRPGARESCRRRYTTGVSVSIGRSERAHS